MIVVKLMGGLGNQMFQYAFAQELKQVYGEDVCFDVDAYQTDKQRSLAIHNLCIGDIPNWRDHIAEAERQIILKQEKVYRVLQRIMRAIHRSDLVGKGLMRRYLKKRYYFNFDPYYYELPEKAPTAVYGYFQGEAYFAHCIDQIKREFRVRDDMPVGEHEAEWLAQIRQSNSVCVHIRKGDYKDAKNKRFDVISPTYFSEGIEYLRQKLQHPHFFVFTNDPEAVAKQYQFPDVTYVTGQKDYQDLRLMMACDHFLISNSTFSWWASYLGEAEDKIVIVPKKWRNNQAADPALMQSKEIRYVRI